MILTSEGFQRKEETIVVALNLEDAYNRTDYTTLLYLMTKMGTDTWIVG